LPGLKAAITGRYLAAGSDYQGLAYFIRGWFVAVWEVNGWKRSERKGPLGNADTVYCLTFSPDSARLAVGTALGFVGLIDLPKPGKQ
jgi:hypothetical protein